MSLNKLWGINLRPEDQSGEHSNLLSGMMGNKYEDRRVAV